VKDPPLWSLNIMNGTNMWFDDILNNATAVNAPFGKNWVQNTDGFDTMDANNIMLTNMVYQGGDDCIAIKPRSYNIFVQNVRTSYSHCLFFVATHQIDHLSRWKRHRDR
jgi:galacturan 1,4-alpha-galacturonidase